MIRRRVKNVKKRKTGNHCVSMIRSKVKNVIKNVIKNVKRETLVYQRFEIDFYVFTSIFQKSKKKVFLLVSFLLYGVRLKPYFL